jgi:hypothetical protein
MLMGGIGKLHETYFCSTGSWTWQTSLAVLAAILVLRIGDLRAEDRPVPRFEVGPLVSAAQTVSPSPVWWRDLIVGYGGRLTANVHPNIAVEFQASSYPSIHVNGSSVRGSGHVKGTLRLERRSRLNIFVVVGPGFSHDKDTCCGGHLSEYRETRFAFNVGGGVELIPLKRLALRLDATDFIVRMAFTQVPAALIHNLDLKIAAMFRF